MTDTEREILSKLHNLTAQVTDMQMNLPNRIDPEPTRGMMPLPEFSEWSGIPKTTLLDWINHDKSFCGKVARKLGRHWYIDMKRWQKWCDIKHANCYKYA